MLPDVAPTGGGASASKATSRAGKSVMIPSTPIAISARMSLSALTVQGITPRPSACAAAIRPASREVQGGE